MYNPTYLPQELIAPGLDWSATVDSFGLGCILVEVWTGEPLFVTTEQFVERLYLIERVLETIPL